MCCVIAFGVASGQTPPAESVPPTAGSAGAVSRPESLPETDYGVWIAPGPDEPAILAGVGEGFGKTALHYSSMTFVVGGTALCAAGVAMAFNGISGGLDSAAIHRGALCFISGSLVAAVFSAVMNASGTKTTSPE
jgi:hypothetical protein